MLEEVRNYSPGNGFYFVRYPPLQFHTKFTTLVFDFYGILITMFFRHHLELISSTIPEYQ